MTNPDDLSGDEQFRYAVGEEVHRRIMTRSNKIDAVSALIIDGIQYERRLSELSRWPDIPQSDIDHALAAYNQYRSFFVMLMARHIPEE
jgi:hypothetical protein